MKLSMENPVPQVAFYGYVFAHTGYGTAARGYVHSFFRAFMPVSVVSLDRFPRRPLKDPIVLSCLTNQARRFAPSVHLWHTEPNGVMRLNRSFRRLAVLTTWETESLPQVYVEALNRAAEVWVPSRYNLEAFQRQLSVPVFRLPHPVNELAPPRFDPSAFEQEMNIPESGFVVAAIGTWQERKNFDGIIEAFLRAFPSDKDAFLILKTSFAFVDERMGRAQIAAAIRRAGTPNPIEAEKRIRIFPYQWPDDCVSSLLHRADCYISLHRGEGWCYPLFDAASIGVPVVATAYSGPMDYLDPVHHRLVSYHKTPANQGKHTIRFAFDSSMSWAKPDLHHAAESLRWVYENRSSARKLAVEAAARIRREYSLDVVGQAARERFIAIDKQARHQEMESLLPQSLTGQMANPLQMPALTTPCTDWDSPSALSFCN
jgi:glycosyltransferase involved in cell wall biosynthesis